MMKRNILFLFLTLVHILSSCNSDDKMNGTGLLRIGVTTDTSVFTKADGDDMEISTLCLVVKTKTDDGTGWSKEYKLNPSSLSAEIELVPGIYELTAIAGDGGDASDGFSPCYKGSTDVTITAGKSSEAKITCTLATVKVSVEYASNVKEIYKSDIKTEVGGLSFTEDKIGTPGYLTAKPFAVNFWYKDNIGGWRSIHVGNIKDVKPQEYYHINISVENEGEGAATITVKVGDKNTEDIRLEVVLPEITIGTYAENVAHYTATLKGTYSAPSGNSPPIGKQKFYYKEKTGTDWTEIAAQMKNSTYLVNITSLKASTTYEYKFMEKGAIKEFTTKTPDITLDRNYKGVTSAVVYGALAEANRSTVSTPFFKYRTIGGTWSEAIPAVLVSGTTYQYKALLESLNSNTTYEYKFMDVTVAERQFTTFQSQPITISKVATGADYATITCLFTGVEAGDAILLDLRENSGEGWKYQGKEYDVNNSDIANQQLKLTGLKQNGTYSIGDETKSFTTLPNANFDNWYKVGKSVYTGLESEGANSYWDTGNAGAVTLSKNPTDEESKDVHTVGGKAAKMVSQYVGVEILSMGKFAAGNLYIGHYCETYMDIYGARIRLGRPFTSRPTQLRGWYKYTRATTIKYGSDPYKKELTTSGGDKCAIYIVLADNAGLNGDEGKTAFEINNKANSDQPGQYIYKSTVDFSINNNHVLAYGSITDEESKGSFDGNNKVIWKQFSLDLTYRDQIRIPKYITIVASASKYGDFFTGGANSTMFIDDFELVYDYTQSPYK